MIGYGGFDKRVLDLLQRSDPRLGEGFDKQSCSCQAWSEQWKWR